MGTDAGEGGSAPGTRHSPQPLHLQSRSLPPSQRWAPAASPAHSAQGTSCPPRSRGKSSAASMAPGWKSVKNLRHLLPLCPGAPLRCPGAGGTALSHRPWNQPAEQGGQHFPCTPSSPGPACPAGGALRGGSSEGGAVSSQRGLCLVTKPACLSLEFPYWAKFHQFQIRPTLQRQLGTVSFTSRPLQLHRG